MKHDANISVRLPAELRERIEEIAAAERRSINQIVIFALEDYTRQTKEKSR